ncbi:hypothetical protein EDD18DRAFT_452585 [Armillaria luteobubalina]|uniref:Uncharacterized protein n=1 Tax=Armillaria luteobubalina TaxID=153913 RepID=A0AA39UQA5_9AGAR|nr:hypothetical protein EDD18DRAFT_452585 [Armillaria luteobubalina]
MPFSLKAAELIAIIVESVLYGIATLLISITLWALTLDRKERHVSPVILGGLCTLAVLSTLHLVADGIYIYRGFISFEGNYQYFLDNTKFTFKNTVYFLETLLADSILIYRCYIVWQNLLVIALPVIFWIGTVVAGAHTIWSIARPIQQANPDTIFAHQTEQWVISFYSIAMATNISATLILAAKLWIGHKNAVRYLSTSNTQHTLRSSIYPILVVILECGAFYSFALIAMIAVYLRHSSAAYLVIDLIDQIIPITFSIVLVRAALVRYEKRDERGGNTSLGRFAARALVRAKPFSGVNSEGTIPLTFKGTSSSGEEDGDQIRTKNKDHVPGSVENQENDVSAA